MLIRVLAMQTHRSCSVLTSLTSPADGRLHRYVWRVCVWQLGRVEDCFLYIYFLGRLNEALVPICIKGATVSPYSLLSTCVQHSGSVSLAGFFLILCIVDLPPEAPDSEHKGR